MNSNFIPNTAIWNRQSAVQFISPPLAASFAIIPFFWGFQLKSSYQTGISIGKFCFKQNLINSFKAAPTIGCIVGTQTIVQGLLEKKFKYKGGSDFISMAESSLLIAAISIIPMAIFNGQTLGYSPTQSLKKISVKQSSAIMAREASFLLSLRVSEPLSAYFKERSGNSQVVHISNFLTGAFGGVIGHPADTALTRWQKGMQINNLADSLKGIHIRAITMGAFIALYMSIKERLAN